MARVEALCQLVEQRGIPRERLLEGSALTPEQLADPMHRIPFARVGRLFGRALDLVGDPAIGLELGLLMSIRSYGFWGYAALASATLGDATINVYQRYHRAFSVADIAVRTEGGTVVIEHHETVPMGLLAPLLWDAGTISFHRVLEFLVGGSLAELEIRLPYPEQSHHGIMRSLIPGRIHFDCTTNQFRFAASEFDRPIRSSDPELARLARAQCELELQRVRADSSLLAQVQRHVKATLSAGALVDRVAREMAMSSRTLRRRLEALGTTYADLVDGVRRGLAIEYLVVSDRTAEEISGLLGYDNPSNFRRAFRRWTGTSPASFREQRLLERG
jgi:AraC-like DNA-binding protein